MTITSDIHYIGVNDYTIDLFEGMYKVPKGMAYNSYVIYDEKIAVLDTVDIGFAQEWFENLEAALNGRKPDFLIIQHMEPDHSANVAAFMEKYPEAVVVASAKAFEMMGNFFRNQFTKRHMAVADGDTLSLGSHKLTFIGAPMVHWPEVMMTYDSLDKTLFTADGFGKFGALDVQDEWIDEARRYYFGIVGKYGVYVQKLLRKAMNLDVQRICPLHGPVLSENVDYYIRMYHKWSKYEPEEEGVLIAYTSIYGNTKKAVLLLEEILKEKGYHNVVVRDLARCDMSEAVSQAFRYSKLVLATTTYNAGIFPYMREFIHWLTERYFCNRVVGFIENGSWAVIAAKLMKEMLEKSKGITFAEPTVKLISSLHWESVAQIEELAKVLSNDKESK